MAFNLAWAVPRRHIIRQKRLTGKSFALDPAVICEQARKLGFDVAHHVNIPEKWRSSERLYAFLEAGFHGEMEWMAKHARRRSHPNQLWKEARGALVVGQSYTPLEDPLKKLKQKNRANISVYARGEDYHELLKKRLKQLARWLCAQEKTDVKVFVDTAPLMEKPLAQFAGLGWQGKHTNLVGRPGGSWLFLGVMLTRHNFKVDTVGNSQESGDHCGSCQKCLDICPTKAFPSPYKLDAQRCISYLTIEHKGSIPVEFRKAMGNRVFGCDDCLAVCPWNKFALKSQEMRLTQPSEPRNEELTHLLQLDEPAFRKMFRRSPIKRLGWERFMRNLLIAAGNSEDPQLLEIVKSFLFAHSPILRESADWAVMQLTRSEQKIGAEKKQAPKK